MPYISKGYFNAVDEALQQGYDIIERFEESTEDSSLLEVIDGDFTAWRTSFLSYLKKHFSMQCGEYIDVFERTDDCNISNVKLYINVLRQIRNGILEEIIFPDSYLKEK